MELKTYFAQDSLGNALASPSVYVYLPDTTTLATGLQNKAGQALTNPFVGGVNGLVQFQAVDGEYDLRIAAGQRDYTIRVQCYDPSDTVASTLAELRALPVPQLQSGATVIIGVLGYHAAHDGGGGLFYWQSNSNEADNGGTVIVPNTLPTSGRWKRAVSEIYNVRWFGAKGDDSTDDAPAIQTCITACPAYKEVLAVGTFLIGATLTAAASNVKMSGKAKLKAKAATNFEYMYLATSKTGIEIEGWEFDANQSNRSSGQNIRFMGAGFSACTECVFMKCKARNTLGYSGSPAVGLCVAGASIRCKAIGCDLTDCGGSSGTNASDGIYMSGWSNLIEACTATNCTDTGFVHETSNFSQIKGCTTNNCSAAAAITNASSANVYGNSIDGLNVFNWDAANTGGIQIGVPTATAGDLVNTTLSGVVMYAETSLSKGDGAAIYVRTAGSGRARGVTIDAPAINGSRNQGILVNGEEVTINAPRIRGTTDACIQFNSGTDHSVNGGMLRGGTFGIYTDNAAELQASCVTMKANGTGIYAASTSIVDGVMNIIKSSTVARIGKAAGATLNLVSAIGSALAVNNVRNSAGSGTVVSSFAVLEPDGDLLGYVDLRPA